jgi:hypothetical protein
MGTHPRTTQLSDPGLPAVATLLAAQPPSPLVAAVAAAGGEITACDLSNVTWWPGSSITTTYRLAIQDGELAGEHDFVAVAGRRLPEGALVVEDGESRIGVWRVPFDPAIPGMDAALDPARTARLLEDLGVPGGPVTPVLRAYRPGRRAVVSVAGREHAIYLKLLRPSKVEALHRRHRHLEQVVPVPHTLGYSQPLGLVALQAMHGSTLRHRLEDPAAPLPAPAEVAGLLGELPEPADDHVARSPIDRLPDMGRLLSAIVPDQADRVEELIERIGPDDAQPWVPAHGDYYEAQLMVSDGSVVGLLDVDTYGWGRPGDDPATMIGHLDLWRHLSSQSERVRAYAESLLDVWDRLVDPVDLRRRIAAVHLTLAPGAFRVQTADWPSETVSRIELAETWVDAAERISEDEKGLTTVSDPSHGRLAT